MTTERNREEESSLASGAIAYFAATVTTVSLIPVLWGIAYPDGVITPQTLSQHLARFSALLLAAASVGLTWLTFGRMVYFYAPSSEGYRWLPRKHDAGDVFTVIAAVILLLFVLVLLAIVGYYIRYIAPKMGSSLLVAAPIYMLAAILLGFSDREKKLENTTDALRYICKRLAIMFGITAVIVMIALWVL